MVDSVGKATTEGGKKGLFPFSFFSSLQPRKKKQLATVYGPLARSLDLLVEIRKGWEGMAMCYGFQSPAGNWVSITSPHSNSSTRNQLEIKDRYYQEVLSREKNHSRVVHQGYWIQRPQSFKTCFRRCPSLRTWPFSSLSNATSRHSWIIEKWQKEKCSFCRVEIENHRCNSLPKVTDLPRAMTGKGLKNPSFPQ